MVIKVCIHKQLGGAEGATHSDRTSEDSFTGRDSKAGFWSQGRALPGREDPARNHPGEAAHLAWGGPPADVWVDQYSREAVGVLREVDPVRKRLRLAASRGAPTLCRALAWALGRRRWM